MDTVNVRIVRLEPQRFASFYSFGPQPEELALKKLQDWAGSRGYLDHPEKRRIFGFNNPDPVEGNPNYGYEFWIAVDPDVEAVGDMRITQFFGGLYAVTHLADPFADPYEIIPAGWKQLFEWLEASSYKIGGHQGLEEHLFSEVAPSGGWSMDLYLPIIE